MVSNLDLIKGIGPKSKSYLKKLKINNINELVTYYPFRYEILKRSDLLSLKANDKIVIDGIVDSKPVVIYFKGKMNKMTFSLKTNQTLVKVIIFNRAFLINHLTLNKTVTVIGKWELTKNTIIANDIILESLNNKLKIIPIYKLTAGLTQKSLKKFISNAITLAASHIIDYLPSFIVDKYCFIDKLTAINLVHLATDEHKLKVSLLRLKYEELFLFMLKIEYLKKHKHRINPYKKKEFSIAKINKFIDNLPFKLTVDQQKSVKDIINDLKASFRMNRLLQGDVGSGKTVVAVIAIYANYLAGYQTALMVPTEVLAHQHFNNIKALFRKIKFKIALLTGQLTKKEKDTIYQNLAKGEIDLIIGTHALIQTKVKYHKLGLVITDEQHRFGVNQRSILKDKGLEPDVLYMSATPIPRTFALTIYGDMDISSIKTIPSGRKKIKTFLKAPSDIKEILSMIEKELTLGHQIYVIAPLIEESSLLEVENVNKLKHQFDLAFGKFYKIGILHGKMNSQAKEKMMGMFVNQKIDILISTTVIEVGIDVPRATMMVIFNANRFGLSTIHQLRGRVGRSNKQSYCILISDKQKERLKILTATNDGFIISEQDFKLRGQGDLFGVEQSGDMIFKIANLKKDYKILLKAKEDAYYFINKRQLNNYPQLKYELEKSIDFD